MFRAHRKIYEGVFSEKKLTAISLQIFSLKGSIIDFRLGFTPIFFFTEFKFTEFTNLKTFETNLREVVKSVALK